MKLGEKSNSLIIAKNFKIEIDKLVIIIIVAEQSMKNSNIVYYVNKCKQAGGG